MCIAIYSEDRHKPKYILKIKSKSTCSYSALQPTNVSCDVPWHKRHNLKLMQLNAQKEVTEFHTFLGQHSQRWLRSAQMVAAAFLCRLYLRLSAQPPVTCGECFWMHFVRVQQHSLRVIAGWAESRKWLRPCRYSGRDWPLHRATAGIWGFLPLQFQP